MKAKTQKKISQTAIGKKQTTQEILSDLAVATGLTVVQIKMVLVALRTQICRHMRPRGSGEISLPELRIKLRRTQRKATKSRQGRNPATGQAITVPARPAKKVIKASVVRELKSFLDK